MDTYITSFHGIRQANLARLTEFGHGTLEDGWGIAEWGCALGGECGELQNVLKKMYRNGPSDPTPDELLVMASEEIADVFLYLDLLAAKLGLDLPTIIARKFNITSEAKGYRTRLTEKES